MKILQRYVLRQLLANLLVSLVVLTVLFLVFDFFDRIDNIVQERPSPLIVFEYFLLKVPGTVSLVLPVAMLVGVLFTIGLLSKNSEITAMRASGLTVRWIAMPVFLVGMGLSILSIALNETIVPYATRRVREIYNIDIKQKHKTGGYSHSDFWWRFGNEFYSVDTFDSRTNTLLGLSRFELTDEFKIGRRTDASEVNYVDSLLGWNMSGVVRYSFEDSVKPEVMTAKQLPLPIPRTPKDFYDAETDPFSMSYRQLQKFIAAQAANGLSISSHLADLYNKLSSPFVNLIMPIVVIPFALRPARSGSMAASVLAALTIGFTYYAVQSFSVSMGRAELLPPLLAAWTANALMGVIGVILFLGSEAPA